MVVPKNLLHIESDSKIDFICKRFDSDMLMFQLFICLVPCVIWFIYLVNEVSVSDSHWFFFFLVVAVLLYWIVFNFKNQIIFTIRDTGILDIAQGFPLRILHSIEVKEIKEIYVHKRYGRTGRYNRGYNSGQTLIQDLIIVKKNGDEINLGSFFRDDHKHYLMKAISEILRKKHLVKYS